jgi:hypothetical protein
MQWLGIALACGALLLMGARVYSGWANSRVIRELRESPQGERAQKVMLLTLPSGHIRAVEDDPELRQSVFARLRPTAPRWTGTLVVIELG